MRPEEEEERKKLESLKEKTIRRREEAKIVKEELQSAIEKVDEIMSKAQNLKKLDLEANSGDDEKKQDTSIDNARTRKQEEAEKERNEMYKMIDELTRTEFHLPQQEEPETQKN